ncbi:MAG: hypothetical protein JW839_05795 [Candidatus Lokiarchaeota archaeon]|nr:hypothetical protein [Candidatus Lokiarchaeota archaeon]
MILDLKAEYGRGLPRNQAGVRFTFAHVVLALLLFDMHGKLGRVELERHLTLGRGSLRTFIDRLKRNLRLVVSSSTRAHVLSERGVEVATKIKAELSLIGNIPVIFDELKFARYNALARLGAPSLLQGRVIQPMALVDVARAHGGKGLLSLVVQSGRSLKVLGVSMDLKKQYAGEWAKLNELFALVEGDLLLIAWADSELEAKLAAIAAAVSSLEMMA